MSKWCKKILQEVDEIGPQGTSETGILCERKLYHIAISGCARNIKDDSIIVTPDLSSAETLAEELRSTSSLFGVNREVYVLPESSLTHPTASLENESLRCRILDLTTEPGKIYIASVLSLLATTPVPRKFRDNVMFLEAGDTAWPPEKLTELLVAMDYDNEVQVSQPGEFSWRGGILDIFSPAYEFPIRLDYWGNAIESMRFFDTQTQRSLDELEHCKILPRVNALITGAPTSGDTFNSSDSKPKRTVRTDRPNEGEWGCELPNFFLDFFERESVLLVFCDLDSTENHLVRFGDEQRQKCFESVINGSYRKLFLDEDRPGRAVVRDAYRECSFHSLPQISKGTYPELSDSADALHNRFLREQLRYLSEKGIRTLVVCAKQPSVFERLQEIIGDSEPITKLNLLYHPESLPSGAVFPKSEVLLLSKSDIVGRTRVTKRPPVRKHFNTDHLFRTGLELASGDYAVHAVYGICHYLGLEKEKFHDRIQEVLVLEFADEVRLLVPLDQACLVSRYIGGRKRIPKLSRIGNSLWKKAKLAATNAVADMAADLIRIQVLRETTSGVSFELPDDHEMSLFSESFPYQETDDQVVAIDDVLGDMDRKLPMDRLICGDVGYGKTEVAMRAACKAILSGRQVAVLVPTTVLAQQHFLTFSDRFKEFPILIDVLSRFRTAREQRRIIEDLGDGKIDIVIGTHRLLQSDLKFKRLGLLIIDEEQRFGVRHKEKLKHMRANIDILTMTATPIPRTLYLSMAGLRDMSTIFTAPLERLPIQTVVTQYDRNLVKDAITREVQRKGQVYYLHNRVRTIDRVRRNLVKLLPDLKIDIAHGRMDEADLEAVMLRFIAGETDVLVCTTIIESGLDIPNANTMIIDRADRFGLAELYQLRGRVGRYHRQAYTYLLLPEEEIILDDAKRRLAAIRRYTQLGAGFKLALRDLEIRGAGNLLGAEQSGHISAVGFELYCRLMKEAVSRLQNKPSTVRIDVALSLDFLVLGDGSATLLSAGIPDNYVHDDELRVELYRRLSLLNNSDDVDEFEIELRDRFGAVPADVNHLCVVSKLKIIAAKAGIHSIKVENKRVILETEDGYIKENGHRFPRLKSTDNNDRLRELGTIISRHANQMPAYSGGGTILESSAVESMEEALAGS